MSRRVDDLSLEECRGYDARPQKCRGRQRFRCPRHHGDNQRSLAVDDDGKFRCHNAGCGIWGTVTEHQEKKDQGERWGGRALKTWTRPRPPLPIAAPMRPNDYAVRRAVTGWKQFQGSPAQAYAVRRGIPPALALALRLGHWEGEWQQEVSEWLTFPLRCPVTGRPVGVYGRNLHSDDQARKGRVLGPRGLFGSALPEPLPAEIVLVEGVFEALALQSNPDLPPARAVVGASARAEWFDDCRRLIVLFDDDEAGRTATERLVIDLTERRLRRQAGPQVLTLRPGALADRYGCKDLGELMARGIPVNLDLPALPEQRSLVESIVANPVPGAAVPLTLDFEIEDAAEEAPSPWN